MPEREVTEMEKRLAARDMAFDPAPGAADDEEVYTPAAYLPNPDSDPAVRAEEEDWETTASRSLYAGLDRLDERSRHILEARWLADDKRTLQDLADEYGISAERVRQLEANAMKKLKVAIAA